jgi:bifunctional N-acetylglucosamine-1-phosphate-uridyltransferase/glucosamine-1-phosphate-acetyltransferase GlmU-like protein
MPARALTVILAAGEGKRMHSILPKVLHRLGRKPLVDHVVQTALKVGLGRVIVVVGHRRDMVIEALVDYPIEIVVQADQRGTGHAMQMVSEYVGSYVGYCLVVPGDAPFLHPESMRGLVDFHESGGYAATILTADYEDPTGYGRIVRNASGDVERIVEHGDATPEEQAITEINSSVYVFDYRRLTEVLAELRGDNQQKELYLTDTIAIIRSSGGKIGALKTEDPMEVMGINDHAQLRVAERIYRELQPPEPAKQRPGPGASEDEGADEEGGAEVESAAEMAADSGAEPPATGEGGDEDLARAGETASAGEELDETEEDRGGMDGREVEATGDEDSDEPDLDNEESLEEPGRPNPMASEF